MLHGAVCPSPARALHVLLLYSVIALINNLNLTISDAKSNIYILVPSVKRVINGVNANQF